MGRCILIFKTQSSFSAVNFKFSSLFCLSGSDKTKRIFIKINKIWTKEKFQMKIEILKAVLVTKTNFEMNCQQFYNFLIESTLLK